MLQRYAPLLASIEAKFGVPRQILVAIWGLETISQGDMGKLPVFRVLATMAHDCRRTELFQTELLSGAQDRAARRSRLARHDRRLCRRDRPDAISAVSYIKYGVDFDGDAMSTSAIACPTCSPPRENLLHTNGFQMGAPYGEGSANFEAIARMEPGHDYRKTIAYFADQLMGR